MGTQGKNRCLICHRPARNLSKAIGICADCLMRSSPTAHERIKEIHRESRAAFHLPPQPPRSITGIACTLCSNECVIGEGERGFCGLRSVRDGTLVHLAGIPARGLVHWYRDALPTNCVADWVCNGHKYIGYHNLAVFYANCTANCLFCQNWHFRRTSPLRSDTISASELASAANERTFCVCFFGGDPSSQMPHALVASRLLAKRGVRICWETNGMMSQKLLDAAMGFSIETGGCIKFDLKAFDEDLHVALTGVSNKRTLENFTRAVEHCTERSDPSLVIASTLLVPGYVEIDQVSKIAGFIASINPQIPYVLLAFAPNFYMSDLPCTSVHHAQEAEAAARNAGLDNVRIGNKHLLGLGGV